MCQAIPATLALPAFDPQDSSSILSARWLPSVRLWTERYRQRRALFNLAEAGTHLLNDIGLARHDALRESAKPFWLR